MDIGTLPGLERLRRLTFFAFVPDLLDGACRDRNRRHFGAFAKTEL